MAQFKIFLNVFCGKRKTTATYTYESDEGQFYCEVRVDGFDFIGCGEARTKKEAQALAAEQFCGHLAEAGMVDPSTLPPATRLQSPDGGQVPVLVPPAAFTVPSPGPPPASTIVPVHPQERQQGTKRTFDQMSLRDEGASGYSLLNAKSRLHLFLDQTRQSKDMNIWSTGPDHNKSFCGEMRIAVPKLNTSVSAQEVGANKKAVGNSLALSLVDQLFRLGAIEAARPPGAKKQAHQAEPKEINIPQATLDKIKEMLTQLNITPVSMPEQFTEPFSLLLPLPPAVPGEQTGRSGVLEWQQPSINWNPWTNKPPVDGSYSDIEPAARAQRINLDLYNELIRRKAEDGHLQESLASRQRLPIASKAVDIVTLINAHPVVVIEGNTGCGKTTQVPQFILDSLIAESQGASCNIVVTQPRRLSAVSVAERVAAERCEGLGSTVGYSVRFESVLPRHYCSILFCTVGVLLRKLENGLVGVSHVIVDEVHERDINSDFLLVVLKDMVTAYPQLRVVLMSATIDTHLFSSYFNNAPIIKIIGKTFPVQEYYLEDAIEMLQYIAPPPEKKKSRHDFDEEEIENLNLVCDETKYRPSTKHSMALLSERDIPFGLIESLLGYFKSLGQSGAVLIFLPGWNSIFALLRQLSVHSLYGSSLYRLLPCHSQIPREDQRRVFEPVPCGVTKVILATNIAESSITIDDVVFVIDAAKAKIKTFTSATNMTQYSTVWASQTSLQQRCGRAGRVRDGYCFHLCSRARHSKLPLHMTPEMLRTPLHEVALSIKLLHLGPVEEFLGRAIEPPPSRTVSEALVLLREMQALDIRDELTPLGAILARLPVEPRLGRMIVLGTIFGAGEALCSIAALSSFQEPFLLPPGAKRLPHSTLHFSGSRCSDHLAMLNAFHQYEVAKSREEGGEFDFCDSNYLSLSSMKMASEAKDQLVQLLLSSGFPEESLQPLVLRVRGNDRFADLVSALLCVGLYPNVCLHEEKRKMVTADGKMALIHKSSVNNIHKAPVFPSPYFIFGEKLKTGAVAAKSTTMVQPTHLLLFGSSSLIYHGSNLVKMDEWLPLDMSLEAGVLIGGLRQAIDEMLIRMTANPALLTQHSPIDASVIATVQELVLSPPTAPPTHYVGPCGGHHGRGFRGQPHTPRWGRPYYTPRPPY